MEIVKICKIHGELTQEDLKTGIYKNKRYRKCKKCELERSRRYHAKKYTDPEWVKQKHERDNLYWKVNKKEITKKRMTPEAKKKRRETYKLNNYSYNRKCKDKQQAYRDLITDPYLRKLANASKENLKFDDLPLTLIEVKRVLLKLKRKVREKK